MKAEVSYKLIEKEFRKRLQTKDFLNGVSFMLIKNEETVVPEAIKVLATWAAEALWKQGYKGKEVWPLIGSFDYGRVMELGVWISAVRDKETVRQFCYQFIELAEVAKAVDDDLRATVNRLRRNPIFRFVMFCHSLPFWFQFRWRRSYEE